ncbi:MAG TPA: glycosyltransferase family 39 protein [Thermoanaerobaculia bacterium]|nr:glycosyltransferase family 39 protein [Thermoanaerobaculia bacterium]
MTREKRVLAAAGLFVAAAAVRLIRLDHFSYGLDEILQAYWISGDWPFFWKSTRFDAVHPPLDYLVARVIEPLGPADWTRKLPAVAWGLGTIACLGALLARRVGRAAGAAAAILLAFAPFHVRYSQEFRPYSLGLFLLTLSLLLLDRYLERPGATRLAAVWLACLATAYALYLAAVVLAIAAAAIIVEEALSPDAARRRTARRFLAWSPAFLAALAVAYLPWWPVVLEAAHRPAPVPHPPMTWERMGRLLSFFSFAPDDGHPLGFKGPLYLLLVALGLRTAFRRPGLRFLAVWPLAGYAVIETLGRLHPHWYVSRRYLPAGLAFPALAALPIAALASKPRLRPLAAIALAAVVVFDLRSLAVYFREGRADWRTLTDYLRRESPPHERVFTENPYTQICTAYYLVGPGWLYQNGRRGREVLNLDGEVARLTWSWPAGRRAWLVVGGPGPPYPELRQWARRFPGFSFPKAEGSVLRRLDPERRGTAFAH